MTAEHAIAKAQAMNRAINYLYLAASRYEAESMQVEALQIHMLIAVLEQKQKAFLSKYFPEPVVDHGKK